MDDLLGLLCNLNVQSMGLNVCGPCLSDMSKNEQAVNPSDAISVFEHLYLMGKDRGMRVRLVTPMPICNFNSELKEELLERRVISPSPCQLANGHNFVIDYNGDILPCTHFTGYALFNIFDEPESLIPESFLERYFSKGGNIEIFRKKMSRYATDSCNGCEENCSGGCPLFWMQYNSSEIIKGHNHSIPSSFK